MGFNFPKQLGETNFERKNYRQMKNDRTGRGDGIK